jgi:transcriptional regulator with PAS, ATPase and Fis domain
LDFLQSHSWAGNVRELENVVERAVILSRGGVLRFDATMLPGAAVKNDSTLKLRSGRTRGD